MKYCIKVLCTQTVLQGKIVKIKNAFNSIMHVVFSGVIASLSLDASMGTKARAADYDLDCAVILCLAGGFPTGCGAAYSYMIDRITSTPPKPPFGFCAMGTITEADFPDNDDPEAHEAMIAVIDDPAVARTLRSVRAEVARRHYQCQRGGDGPMWRCTSMIELNGDGSDLFMGTRGTEYSPFWRRGKRVTFIDFEGTKQSIGDAEHHTKVGRECDNQWRQDNCRDIFEWQSIARPAEENTFSIVVED